MLKVSSYSAVRRFSSAAERGFGDDVIEAHATRPTLIRWIELLQTKLEPRPARKHGNIPL